jgi:tetratricopeptide (TPR) repeat protein
VKLCFPNPACSVERHADVLDCGGKRSATPLWEQDSTFQKRRRRFALPAQSKTVPKIAAIFLFLLTTFSFAGNLFAADVSADFSAANKHYAEGKFADAANAYEKILQSGKQSPALLFNAGNAEYKAGHLGKAIAAYRRAALLTPRDPELRANLEFVRNQVHGSTVRESRWRVWLNTLSLNEGTVLTAVLFWLMLGLFAARQIRPALAPRLRGVTRLAVALTIFSATILGLQAASHFNGQTAVVTEAEASARSGPFDEAQSVFPVHDGAELPVLDRHDDWLQVANDAGKIGWLNQKQVEVLPGE